jgi:hypothetical protein
MDVDMILREMENNYSKIYNPLIQTSKIMPKWIAHQTDECKFVMSLSYIDNGLKATTFLVHHMLRNLIGSHILLHSLLMRIGATEI